MQRGFSTLEIMIAFAIMSLVFGGVMLADFSSNYWVIASQTSNEGLYKAKTRLEELRAASRQDFYSAVSSPAAKDMDASCTSGSLCYFVESVVTDISTCSKYAQAVSSWAVRGYPTTTTSLPTHLTYPAEAISLGGDCLLNPPKGTWASAHTTGTASVPGNPKGVDALGGITYVVSDTTPYLATYYQGGLVAYTNNFKVSDPVNGFDVARDAATGRTYAFLAVASTTGQLAIVDVTDQASPTEITRVSLAGVVPTGSAPQGWRVAYYGQRVYITVRETAGPELHIFDVANPAAPNQLASVELNTSVYDLVVRDEESSGTTKRFAYLATTKGSAGKVLVYDVTTPGSVVEVTGAATTLPTNAKSLALAGRTLYVGTDAVSGGGEVYALNVTNPGAVSGGFPTLFSGEVGAGVVGLKVAGEHLFALASTQASPLVSTLLDVDGDTISLAKNAVSNLRVWTIGTTLSSPVTISLGSSNLQRYESN